MAKKQNNEVSTEPKSDLFEEGESMPSDHVKLHQWRTSKEAMP